MIKTTRLDLINLLQDTLPNLLEDAKTKVFFDSDAGLYNYIEAEVDKLVMEYTRIIVSALEESN
jgi:hypothetical protein